MSLTKNIDKFKQFVGEKFGNAQKTESPAELKDTLDRTDNQVTLYESMAEAATIYFESVSGKKKTLKLEEMGTRMRSYGNYIGGGYGEALKEFGQVHQSIAASQVDFAFKAQEGFIKEVECGLEDVKEYNHLKKKLESRRLDYDAKQNKVQKAKKEKPELEEETKAAQAKYEVTLSDLERKVELFEDRKVVQLEELKRLVDYEINFYEQSLRNLKELKSVMETMQETRAPSRFNLSKSLTQGSGLQGVVQAVVAQQAIAALPMTLSNSSLRTSTSIDLSPFPKLPSSESISSLPPRSYLNEQTNTKPAPVSYSPSAPMDPSKKVVKALYDFDSSNAEELSIRVGDLITVLEEIDQGWWIGEKRTAAGCIKGMFPVNYTQIVQEPKRSFTVPSPPVPRSMPKPRSVTNPLADEAMSRVSAMRNRFEQQ